jgi:hypothetical protein
VIIIGKKFNIEYVRKYIESFNHRLLSKEYKNGKQELKIICENNHIFYRSFERFKNRIQDCPICKKENNIHWLSLPLDKIIKDIELHNYKIIDGVNKYKNGKSKFTLQCPNNHIFEIKIGQFKIFHNCPYCTKKVRITLEFARNEFKNRNLILLATEYKNSKTNMPYRCLSHPSVIQYINWDHFQRGQGCGFCRFDKIRGENHYCWKGGITSLKSYLSRHITEWKKESMKSSGYKCVICSERNK